MLVTSIVVIGTAVAYQYVQMEKMKKAAKAAAEARKGFEIVNEGNSYPIPIVYGRAKVGGVRVWSQTKSSGKLILGDADDIITTAEMPLNKKSTDKIAFTHPGTNSFRINFPQSVINQISGSGVAGIVSFSLFQYSSTYDDYGYSYDFSNLDSTYTITYSNLTATGVDITLTRKLSNYNLYDWGGYNGNLSGKTFYYSIQYVESSSDLNGSKNEYLFIQQAICQAPINKVYDVVIDNDRFIDDPEFSVPEAVSPAELASKLSAQNVSTTTYSTEGSGFLKRILLSIELGNIFGNNTLKKFFRVETYNKGGIAHSTVAYNFKERADAKFTKVASATIIVKLDRDDPQFQGIPDVSFLLEGKLVKTIIRSGSAGAYTYSLASTATYSNNPALCLLDYLMDSTCGKALTTSQIDLESFYKAKEICNRIVQTNVPVGGKIWRPTNKSRDIRSRDLPLYECNLVLDVTKPVRENVEAILRTMGDARLVWSAGKYKLSLQYPGVN